MGYKTNYLVSAAMRLAVESVVIPALQQVPAVVGRAMANQRWTVHLYGLCRANPTESFCCVTPVTESGNPFGGADCSLAPSLPVLVVPSRFVADPMAVVGIRPSSTAAAISFQESWMGSTSELVVDGADQSAGVTLIRFHRQSDGMEFLGARSLAAAQAAAAALAQTMPLWHQLVHQPQGLNRTLAQLAF
jgi:hypothetical protein